ncbi:Crp/Fnr family transcriptional regulator [Nocardioides sp. KR10-350]|uniref:Crp/Fnr family transcriptional regulator n=1 Tax=Nocardioides cheoyonin TaxID=3156615 RepID=UPI0032B5BD32
MSGVAAELARVRLFAALDDAALQRVAAAAFTRRIAANQILFVTGEPSEHLYVVRSGLLRVLTTSPHGEQFVLSTVGPGEVIGELSLLDRKPRSADVVAAELSELVAVPADVARGALMSDPQAVLAAACELAAQVRRLTGTMGDLVFLDLPRRVAKLLLLRARAGSGGRTVSDLGASQSVVAAQLGVSRQSVNKALSGLARHAWIELDGKSVVLRDPVALQRYVES